MSKSLSASLQSNPEFVEFLGELVFLVSDMIVTRNMNEAFGCPAQQQRGKSSRKLIKPKP